MDERKEKEKEKDQKTKRPKDELSMVKDEDRFVARQENGALVALMHHVEASTSWSCADSG